MKYLMVCLLTFGGFISSTLAFANNNSDKKNLVKEDYCKTAPTIFVSVASYRDSECPNTVSEIFNKAQCPNRITVGICQQNDAKQDVDCLQEYKRKNKNARTNQIKIMRLKHTEAKGPTWARYLASTLWENEDYYLQIDSHTLFLPKWDNKLITMIKKAPTKKSNSYALSA